MTRGPVVSVVDPARLVGTANGFLHHVHEGRWLPPFITVEGLRALQTSWDTCERDIFVATAQKVGTHLTKRFVVEILAEAGAFPEGHPCAKRDIGHGAFPWPEVTTSQYGMEGWREHLEAVERGPRLWYLHCDVDDLPMRSVHPKARFLVCYRDPKAVCVSQFHFYKTHPLLGVDPALTLPSFVELFLEGDLYFGDYHAHVRRWVERASPRIAAESLLLLRYEDLVEAKEASVARMAAFLLPGASFSPESVARIIERTAFDAMKEEMTKNPQTFHFKPEVFFRAGTTDDWRNRLTEEQVARIDAKTARLWACSALV
jgi:hypothetical protein